MPWVTGAGTGTGIARVATGEECSVMGARGDGPAEGVGRGQGRGGRAGVREGGPRKVCLRAPTAQHTTRPGSPQGCTNGLPARTGCARQGQEACPAVARGSSARGQTRKLPRPRRPGAASARASGTPRLAQGGGHTGGLADAKRREGARARGRRRCQGSGRHGWGAEQRVWEHAPGDAGNVPGKSRMSAQQRRLRGRRSGGNGRRAAC